MKQIVLAMSLLCLSGAAAAEPVPAAPAQPLRARLHQDVIKEAVRETLAEAPRQAKAAPSGQVLSGDSYRRFERDFSEAQKPSCLRPDALRHQVPGLSTKNWNFGAGGLLALPFWAAAIVGGKCN